MWRTMRLAWQPAFQSGSLEGYTDLMDDCAAQLAQVRHKDTLLSQAIVRHAGLVQRGKAVQHGCGARVCRRSFVERLRWLIDCIPC